MAGGVFGVVGNIVAGTASSAEIIIGGQALNGIGSSLFVSDKLSPYVFACSILSQNLSC